MNTTPNTGMREEASSAYEVWYLTPEDGWVEDAESPVKTYREALQLCLSMKACDARIVRQNRFTTVFRYFCQDIPKEVTAETDKVRLPNLDKSQ